MEEPVTKLAFLASSELVILFVGVLLSVTFFLIGRFYPPMKK